MSLLTSHTLFTEDSPKNRATQNKKRENRAFLNFILFNVQSSHPLQKYNVLVFQHIFRKCENTLDE